MKYLRKFYESANKEIIQNCKDILLELDDIGFLTIVSGRYKSMNNHAVIIDEIWISIIKKEFSRSDVDDCVLRLIDYLGSEGFRQKDDKSKEYPSIRDFRKYSTAFGTIGSESDKSLLIIFSKNK